LLRAREAVNGVPSYHPPLGGRDGLRLDFNENTVGCSPRVVDCLRRLTADELARYPEREPVEAMVAAQLELASDEVLLTNGTDEAIHLLCETYLDSDCDVLIVVPTFSMYRIYAAATGARVIPIPAGENFRFPLEAILRSLTQRVRLIAIANPNNPTGAVAPQTELLQLAETAPDAAILIDEAYFEFCQETVLPRFREIPNLFVARTFSKAYGLAGLRVGILAGHAGQMRPVRRVSSPYNVNGVALACLPEALADQNYVQRYVAEVCEGRRRLQEELLELGIRHWPSRANFVLADLGPLCALFVQAMRERGILVRDRSSDHGCQGCVRITLGSAAQNEQLLTALRETLRQLNCQRGVPA
jgi:histidinol-phosphate aminotransferase